MTIDHWVNPDAMHDADATHPDDLERLLRHIPPVHDLADRAIVAGQLDARWRDLANEAARQVIDEYRARVLRNGAHPAIDLERETIARLGTLRHPPLSGAINATGIIIHTGLGRAPLADEAVESLANVAQQYTPVELDIESGERGKRADLVRSLLTRLTGAESATVVNNNAAALVLVLATVAPGREVIVSRGELIEIGGSFRLPELMTAAGVRLREVGTTNKTRLSDFTSARNDETAAILAVHPSNYTIEGFSESAPIVELVSLARKHELPLIHDIGSGLLRPSTTKPLDTEPNATTSIRAGVDLVLFSGDKLLGGPQAGIIVGRNDLIARIERHPMMRAMRVDKLVLAALGVTLQLHRDRPDEIPVLRMINTRIDEILVRASAIEARLSRGAPPGWRIGLEDSVAYPGGGSVPTQAIPSVALTIESPDRKEDEFARQLRLGQPAVFCRIQQGRIILDLRTVLQRQDDDFIDAVSRAMREVVAS